MTIHAVETHFFSSQENVLDVAVIKKEHADSILGHERAHYYPFPWEKVQL